MIGAVAASDHEIAVVFQHVQAIFLHDAVEFPGTPARDCRITEVHGYARPSHGMPTRWRVRVEPVADAGIAEVSAPRIGAAAGFTPSSPEPELHAALMRPLRHRRHAVRKLAGISVPVADVLEPSGVNMHHFQPEMGCIVHHGSDLGFADVQLQAPRVVDQQRIERLGSRRAGLEDLRHPAPQVIAGIFPDPR